MTVIIIIIGTVLAITGLPGTFLIWLAVLLNSWYFGFESVGVLELVVLFIMAIIGYFVDNIGAIWGMKKMGVSNWAILGALIGAVFGYFLFQMIGMVLGAFLGAVLTEFLRNNKEIYKATKSGIATLFSILFGIILRTVFIFIMIVVWLLFLVF